MLGQNVAGKQREQLIGPQDLTTTIDHADAVAITIERDTNVERLGGDGVLQLHEVGRHGGVGVMSRECSVDLGVDQGMRAGKTIGKANEHVAGGAVAGIPTHLEHIFCCVVLQKPVDIRRTDIMVVTLTFARQPVTPRRALAEIDDVGAEKPTLAAHQFETVMVGRIVRSRHHDAAVEVERMHGVVQHGSRPAPDPYDMRTRFDEPANEFAFEVW